MVKKKFDKTWKKFQNIMKMIDAVIEDTTRNNIAQIKSTSKAYIPYLLANIIKWCHIIALNRRHYRDGGC